VQAPAVERIAMRQTWRSLTFLHWPYDPVLIRPFIPAGLELDIFGGAAWIGLVPFEIYGTPLIPHFPETNLRTYVRGPDGGRAVWFFSLEAARLVAVLGARIGYHLPYFWAKMSVASGSGAIHYRSRRHWPHHSATTTDIVVRPGTPYQPHELTDLDHFLTARFRLYALSRGSLRYAEIEHAPWPLARADVVDVRQTLFESAGLPTPLGAPLAHYSAELSVKIGFLI
jgi:uncharacterized protein YqjF (DUF2071 family)